MATFVDDPTNPLADTVTRLLTKNLISDALCRYARGVDRGDWDLVRSSYHHDAYDDHVEFRGGVTELIEWLEDRFKDLDNSSHFLGNSLVEQVAPNLAFVETYFISSRLVPAKSEMGDGVVECRQSWGRYLDRFEMRDGEWKVSRRKVVVDSQFSSEVQGGARNPIADWMGRRSLEDPLYDEFPSRGSSSEGRSV